MRKLVIQSEKGGNEKARESLSPYIKVASGPCVCVEEENKTFKRDFAEIPRLSSWGRVKGSLVEGKLKSEVK